jgi:ribonuclease D
MSTKLPRFSTLIESADELEALCRHLRSVGRFAFDTEFVKERTYFAQLGTVQVAFDESALILDPLATGTVAPLLEVLVDPSVEKIVHSGVQDCEVLFLGTGKAPVNLFDTQIAAALAGYGEQISYAKLVASIAGVRLAKLETRTDWRRRPLSERQIRYALDDVRYLRAVRDHLDQRLQALGRRSWALAEFRELENAEAYREVEPQEAFRRISVGSLSPRERGVLRELAAWREAEAQRRDLPRGWVARDPALVEIARRSPKTVEALKRISSLEPQVLDRSGLEILERVQRGLAHPLDEPRAEREEDPVETEWLSRFLEAWLRSRAEEVGVAASLLGTRDDLRAIAAGHRRGRLPDRPLLRGWRREVIGEDLLSLLSGRMRLAVDPESGRIRAEPHEGAAERKGI